MKRSTLFYDPRNDDCKKAKQLLRRTRFNFDLLDVTTNGISSYLFEDMRISTLPALYVFSKNKYKLYEGLDKIEALMKKGT